MRKNKGFIGNMVDGMSRSYQRKATNAAKQTLYYAMWGEKMPAKKRKVKDVEVYNPWI